MVRVGVLGATGAVGQRFLQLLENHPWFVVEVLGASEGSAGKTYKDAAFWRLEASMPESFKDKVVVRCDALLFKEKVDLVFSALDSSVAGEIETAFASLGIPVFSNSSNHRMDPFVPILVPYVNPTHLEAVKMQEFPSGGFIVTGANCSSTGLAVVLNPLHRKWGIKSCHVVTMQAISGAGYPGVSSLDIVDNVIPLIKGEEPKMETEPNKILGNFDSNSGSFLSAGIKISAHCNRVAVIDGHTECVSLSLNSSEPVSVEDIKKCFLEFQAEISALDLPSAAKCPIVLMDEDDRPQPRLDRNSGSGFSVCIGRIRPCPLFGFKFVILSHNTVLGAAGGSILGAELAISKSFIKSS